MYKSTEQLSPQLLKKRAGCFFTQNNCFDNHYHKQLYYPKITPVRVHFWKNLNPPTQRLPCTALRVQRTRTLPSNCVMRMTRKSQIPGPIQNGRPTCPNKRAFMRKLSVRNCAVWLSTSVNWHSRTWAEALWDLPSLGRAENLRGQMPMKGQRTKSWERTAWLVYTGR